MLVVADFHEIPTKYHKHPKALLSQIQRAVISLLNRYPVWFIIGLSGYKSICRAGGVALSGASVGGRILYDF